MKKVLSLILAVCMLASFAMVASADTPATIKLAVVEGADTVTADIVLAGAFTDVNAVKVVVKYNAEQVTLTGDDMAEKVAAGCPATWVTYDPKSKVKSGSTYYVVEAAEGDNVADNYLDGEDFVLATLTFNKLADIAAGDISIVGGVSFPPAHKTSLYSANDSKVGGTSGTFDWIDNSDFTNYVEVIVPEYPTIELDAAAADVAEIDVENDTYTVTVTGAPVFGKAYVVYANGEAIVAGTKYTATEDTVITVALEDDTTKAIHTYAKAYAAAGEAAVFAKFTNGAADYGFEVAAFADDTFSPDMEVFIKDGVFAAANAVDGVFGVKFTGVEAGSYDAVPYADGVKGDAITFEVE